MNLRELWAIFFRLGLISFGGPVAHIALMQREWVERRGALSNQEFLDLAGAMSLIPGPNSTELTMAIGQRQAGTRGLWVAGAAFILPAFCMVFVLAYFYARFGQLPLSRAILYGVQPVVIAVIFQAGAKLLPTALKSRFAQIIGAGALILVASGCISEIVVLFGAALLGLVWGRFVMTPKTPSQVLAEPKAENNAPQVLAAEENDENGEISNRKSGAWLLLAPLGAGGTTGMLLLSFLKIGCILYGSGYVLLAFLRQEFVPRWLSDAQLLDAISIGQITPGPVFTTATFVGFQIGAREGWGGAVLGAFAATIGIFLPSFLLVKLLLSVLKRARNSPITRSFLDAVNAASLALMAAVSWQLAGAAIVDVPTALIALFALAALTRSGINAAWLMGIGAICGWLVKLAL